MCKHENIHYHVNRNHFENTNLEYVEISGKCSACGDPVQFRCDMVGMSPHRPAVDLAGTSMVLPCTIGDAVYDEKGAHGYIVRDGTKPQEPSNAN